MSIRIATLAGAAALLFMLPGQPAAGQSDGNVEPIMGHVIESETGGAPRTSVWVRYDEHDGNVEHRPLYAHTGTYGEFAIQLRPEMGKFGLLSVREEGYNNALLVWPTPVDRGVVLYLTKPVEIHGRVIDEGGAPVDGSIVKWSMPYQGRLASGVTTVAEDGSFYTLIPEKSDALRIAAWADDYAPTLTTFSHSPDEMTDTVLQTLEKARNSGSHLDAPDWLRDWVDELLLGRALR
jgi:hypothetical protein